MSKLAAIALITISALLVGMPTNAATLSSLKSDYETYLKQLVASHKTYQESSLDQYQKNLDLVQKMYQKRGDLDGLLAARAEKQRFEKEKTVPSETDSFEFPVIKKVREMYYESLSEADHVKDMKTRAKTQQHLANLNRLMKQLTMQDKLNDAVEVQMEIKRVKASMPAESASRTKCTQCAGTGKTAAPCGNCTRGGRCTRCRGRGRVQSGLRGRGRMIACIGCQGTGKCRHCSGTSTLAGANPCPTCRGTGTVTGVARTTPSVSNTPAATSRPSKTPTRPTFSKKKLTMDEIEDSLSDYVNTMSGLNKQHTDGKHTNADFGAVMADPLQYKGKLVRSEAVLVHAHARAVRVRGGSGQPTTLVPYSQKVGTKAVNIMSNKGANSRTLLTYGVVNADNITLFGIDAR